MVQSGQVADARIEYAGDGAIQRSGREGWLSKFFNAQPVLEGGWTDAPALLRLIFAVPGAALAMPWAPMPNVCAIWAVSRRSLQQLTGYGIVVGWMAATMIRWNISPRR
jgi:hypothetical protein